MLRGIQVMTGAAALLRWCAEQGTDYAFVVPSADIAPIVEELDCNEVGVRAVFAAHENMAGVMADGYFRRSGRFGLAIAGGDVGAIYLAPAAAAAAREGIPVLFVTGSVGGGQELDGEEWEPSDLGIFRSSGAVSLAVRTLADLPHALAVAGKTLSSGRPVHLVVPRSVQAAVGPVPTFCDTGPTLPDEAAAPPVALLDEPRTVLAVGVGALAVGEPIRELARRLSMPVITDMTARGLLREDDELSFGHLGFMPGGRAQLAVSRDHPMRADRIVALAPSAPLAKTIEQSQIPLAAVAQSRLAHWLQAAARSATPACKARESWLAAFAAVPRRHEPPDEKASMTHTTVVLECATVFGANAVHVFDAGQFHSAGAAFSKASSPRTVLTPSGLASMGWALGAALGARCADPESPVVAYMGDGSFLMHGLELATAVRHQLPVVLMVAANGVLGSAWSRSPADSGRVADVDIAGIIRACGVDVSVVADRAQLVRVLKDVRHTVRPHAIVVQVPRLDPHLAGLATGVEWLDRDLGVG